MGIAFSLRPPCECMAGTESDLLEKILWHTRSVGEPDRSRAMPRLPHVTPTNRHLKSSI